MHTPPPTVKLSAAAKAVEALGAIEASADLAKAFDELEAWIQRNPTERACWCLEKLTGKWKVGLSVRAADWSLERITAGEDRDLRGAIRNALMIAKFAGYV